VSLAKWPVHRREFICAVCHLPGTGAPNSLVHKGECKKEWQRRTTHRAYLREHPQKVMVAKA
jgi:hypothetical protein